MKFCLSVLSLILAVTSTNAQGMLPAEFTGHWKGELLWYKVGRPEPQKVTMELLVTPLDSIGIYNWTMIYGESKDDTRPYILSSQDSAGVHWKIDEKNGIILDQYFVANRLCGSFTVMGNTLSTSYRVENGIMIVEFFTYNAKPISVTGKGTSEIPSVDSYRMGAYQKAMLYKL